MRLSHVCAFMGIASCVATGSLFAQSSPVIHWVNDSGQDGQTVLTNHQTFVTNFKGINDVSASLLNQFGVSLYRDNFGGPTPGNNPGYLTTFVGSPGNGTGDGSTGNFNMLATSRSVMLQMDFAIPITPSDRILFADVDNSEQYTVQAFTLVGGTYTSANLSGWVEQDFSGQMGVIPDGRWASWSVSPDGLTGTFTANANYGLNEPLSVLTTDQSISRLIITQQNVGFSGNAAIQVISPASPTIDAANKYAYGANIGWTSWLPSAGEGVVIGEFICSGTIYAANVGWINMGGGSPLNHIQYQNNSAADFGVNYSVDPSQPGVGILRGCAYSANIGYINFEALGNPRISLFTGALSGYAYSANCGWINLNDSLGKVQTDHIAMGVDTNFNGIADAWEYLYFGGLLAPGQQNSSPNGNGMTLLQDYLDGVDPTVANSGFRVTAFATNPGGATSVITFTSTAARLYMIETNPDLLSAWQLDPTFGTQFAPDAGTSTTRTITATSAAKRFYRVKTMRPLP